MTVLTVFAFQAFQASTHQAAHGSLLARPRMRCKAFGPPMAMNPVINSQTAKDVCMHLCLTPHMGTHVRHLVSHQDEASKMRIQGGVCWWGGSLEQHHTDRAPSPV